MSTQQPLQQSEERTRSPLELLDEVELLVLCRRYDEAASAFIRALSYMTTRYYNTAWWRSGASGDPSVASEEACERAVTLWREILSSDAKLELLHPSLVVYTLPMLHVLMMGTSLGNLDDFVMAQHQLCGGQYTSPTLIRLLLAWCPGSRVGLDIFAYYEQLPELVLGQAIATIGGMALVSDAASRDRDAAIELLRRPDIRPGSIANLGLARGLLDAWMRCSYADHPRKHEVKRFLSEVMVAASETLRQQGRLGSGGKPVLALRGQSDKPLLVVPLEAFQSNHAMFRCYAGIVAGFRERFYTVGLAAEGTYDDLSSEQFDEFYDIKEIAGWDSTTSVDVRPVMQSIAAWQPAAVFYPSIGMTQWVVELAQERLAPVQAMMFGHPATSMSPAIDFALLYDRYLGSRDCLSEEPVFLPDGVEKFRLPKVVRPIDPLPDLRADQVVRIAIPSVAQKLSGSFIRALRAAKERAKKPVEFVFFLGVDSMLEVACERNLRRELDNAVCFSSLDYNDYIFELNRCHLHAGSFPFGGTNSLIDSLRQGLPILVFEGDEPHSRIDADFIRRVRLPESFVCHSPEEYSERLTALINDPDELLHWRRYLLRSVDVDKVFLEDGRPELAGHVLEELCQRGRRVKEFSE